MSTNCTDLDLAIKATILNGKRTFIAIRYSVRVDKLVREIAKASKRDRFRILDGRLQALRKKGVITFNAGEWSLVVFAA